jgi:hypothetical protein
MPRSNASERRHDEEDAEEANASRPPDEVSIYRRAECGAAENLRIRALGLRTATATAVSQLPYTGAEIAKWLFRQEEATVE